MSAGGGEGVVLAEPPSRVLPCVHMQSCPRVLLLPVLSLLVCAPGSEVLGSDCDNLSPVASLKAMAQAAISSLQPRARHSAWNCCCSAAVRLIFCVEAACT